MVRPVSKSNLILFSLTFLSLFCLVQIKYSLIPVYIFLTVIFILSTAAAIAVGAMHIAIGQVLQYSTAEPLRNKLSVIATFIHRIHIIVADICIQQSLSDKSRNLFIFRNYVTQLISNRKHMIVPNIN